jgi:hypothetical protein
MRPTCPARNARIPDMKLQYSTATERSEAPEFRMPLSVRLLSARLAAPALAATLALSLAACAGGPPRGAAGGAGDLTGAAYRQSVFLSGAALLFVQFDRDGDYVTTRAEIEAGATAEWAKASNGAATLTPIAFETWAAKALGGPNLGPYRLAFDTNVNNEITQGEFSAAILAKFDFWDKDRDGRLARAEMTERLPEMRRPEGAPAPQGARPPSGQRRPR